MRKWICAALLLCLLLTGCGARIQTPLDPAGFVQTVELRDGTLFFNEGSRSGRIIEWAPGFYTGTVTRREAEALLGFDIEAVTAALPEPVRLRWDNLDPEVVLARGEDGAERNVSGITIRRDGAPCAYFNGKPARTQCLILQFNLADWDILEHYNASVFRILPRERRDKEYDVYYDYTWDSSWVDETEVGLIHEVSVAALWPDEPEEIYYAGFYAGGLAVTLESHFSYCTQEEFVELLLALIDVLAG